MSLQDMNNNNSGTYITEVEYKSATIFDEDIMNEYIGKIYLGAGEQFGEEVGSTVEDAVESCRKAIDRENLEFVV